MIFEPGFDGIVTQIKCVPVRGNKFFVCVDYMAPETCKIERVALEYDNILEVLK